MTIEATELKKIIEGALLAAGQPLDEKRLAGLFAEQELDGGEGNQVSADEIRAALEAIVLDCENRGFELKRVGSGWRFQVREETAPWVNRLWDEKPQKYSRALLETLALIAYRQPITRGDIEEIRGVAVSSHIIKTLTEREWVKVVGHRDVPGRPSLYATTKIFLDYFNLSSLEDLPSLGELADIDNLNPELDLGAELGQAAASQSPVEPLEASNEGEEAIDPQSASSSEVELGLDEQTDSGEIFEVPPEQEPRDAETLDAEDSLADDEPEVSSDDSVIDDAQEPLVLDDGIAVAEDDTPAIVEDGNDVTDEDTELSNNATDPTPSETTEHPGVEDTPGTGNETKAKSLFDN